MRRQGVLLLGLALAAWSTSARAEDIKGAIKSVDLGNNTITVLVPGEGQEKHEVHVHVQKGATVRLGGQSVSLTGLKPGDNITVHDALDADEISADRAEVAQRSVPEEVLYNFRHNLFKPLLLFFYMGFLVPILKVEFEFPYVLYQALTIYLLITIGWKGGEELALLPVKTLGHAAGFMGVGVVTNFLIGVVAYFTLRVVSPKMRHIDQATVAGYYGSDSAGTFVTCLGVLTAIKMQYDAYMPVMLAVMEIPGCLVALYLVSRLRNTGMDPAGNMPGEPNYSMSNPPPIGDKGRSGHGEVADQEGLESERRLSLEKREDHGRNKPSGGIFSAKLLHEVFLNPGLYLLFGGILIGFISRLQGPEVTRADDSFFNTLFQGVLCLFLLEMGMTASRKLKDLATAGPGYIAFGLIAPNVFATFGIVVAHTYSHLTHTPFEPGTYILFSVLCAAASYIAVPAVQRLAIPEASPTLPLAASLGLTFSYNVTIGIPIYIEIAKALMKYFPVT